MHYEQFYPSPALTSYIKFFWVLDHQPRAGELSSDVILPDGCTELIFHFGDFYQQIHSPEVVEKQPRSFVIAQMDKFIEIMPTGNTSILAVRFLPYGIQPFLPFPVNELPGKAVGIEHIFGQEGFELEDRLFNCKNSRDRIKILEYFLVSKLQANQMEDALVAECVKRINQSNGNVQINNLLFDLNISHRQLERRFTSAVGLSPKLLSRIVRFQNVFKLIENRQVNSLTALAYEGGYYDQAHFIRDFKAFSGKNPSNYFNESHLLSDHFVGS